MNLATRSNVAAIGVMLAISGMNHGLFEILQGSKSTYGLIIRAIGPELNLWGTEEALTVIPNFLWTGILAIDAWPIRRLTMKDTYQLGRVQGHANIITTSGDHTTYYEVHVGGEKFEVDEGITDVIEQGESYTIYYVKDYNEIVAAETGPAGK